MMSQKRCELNIVELKQYDGTGPSGKLYVAVNGKIFDVTDKGSQFYGKGTPRPACMSQICICTYVIEADLASVYRLPCALWGPLWGSMQDKRPFGQKATGKGHS